MNKTILLTIILLPLVFAGCQEIQRQVTDPNSGINRAVDTAQRTLPIVGAGATASGTPWGALVATVCAGLLGLTNVYTGVRAKITQDRLNNVTVATGAVVQSIEQLAGLEVTKDGQTTTLGEIIKPQVKAKLQDNDVYLIGKAVIEGLKRTT